jgi:sugar lactone lactonase YvrE
MLDAGNVRGWPGPREGLGIPSRPFWGRRRRGLVLAGSWLCLLAGGAALTRGAPPAAAALPAVSDRAAAARIETLAGGGAVGDGGPARRARLNLPGGVTEAPNGDLVVVDFGNHRVRRIDHQTGLIETIAGTGEAGYNGDGIPAARAQLARPEYAVFGPRGELYIADSYNNRVRRIDPQSGLISTVAGTGERGSAGDGGPATAAQLHFPEGIAVDAQGNLFVSDTVNRRIRRVDAATGRIVTYAGSGEVGGNAEGVPAAQARFLRLARIAVDRAGNLYVADSPSHRIWIIDAATHLVHTFAGTGRPGWSGDGGPATEAQIAYPEGVMAAPDGDLYFADTGNHRIRKVEARSGRISTIAGTGEKGFSGDGGPAREARFWSPGRVWVDHAGGVLISDNLNSRIRRVDPKTGRVETVAGSGEWGDGGPADQAVLSVPGDVVYAAGKVYIADYGTQRVRCVDLATRRITTVAGGGMRAGEGIAAVEAELLMPEGIAVDGRKALYIADNLASRVWRVDLATGLMRSFAGTGVAGDGGDGGPATSARLYLPAAVSVGPDGAVYIADFGNRAVRVVDPATGTIRRLQGAAPGADPLRAGVTSLEATSAGLFHLVLGAGDVRLFDLQRRVLQPLPTLEGLAPAASGDSQIIGLAIHEPFVYLADALAHRVVRLNLDSAQVAVVAGSGVQGFGGDGGPAERAALFQPGGVAVSDDGRELFIADTKNHRIRRVRFPDAQAAR